MYMFAIPKTCLKNAMKKFPLPNCSYMLLIY